MRHITFQNINKNHLLIWLILSFFFSFVVFLDPFPVLRNVGIDLLVTPQSTSGKIVILKIDDKSLNKIGQWPWPRENIARIVRSLDNASVIGIDLNFKETSRFGEEDDFILENAFKDSVASVVLPSDVQIINNIGTSLSRFAPYTYEGFSNIILDSDGVARFIETRRQEFPSFAYIISSIYKRGTSYGEPLFDNDKDLIRIRYRGVNNTYPSFSVIDVLNNKVPRSATADKIVLIGVTASDIKNFHQTSFGLMSGIEIQANSIDTFLDEIFYTFNPWMSVVFIFALVFIVVWISAHIRNIFLLLSALFITFVLYIAITFVSFSNFIILDLLYPGIAIIGTVLIFNIFQYISISRKEQILRASFDHLNAMVKSISEGIVMTDKNYVLTVVNPAARKIIGLKDKKEITIFDFVDNLEGRFDIRDKLKKSIKLDKILVSDEVLIKDRFYQIIVSPVKSSSSLAGSKAEILGGVTIFHDITHEKEIEQLREDFMAIVVHELRTPLTGIKNLAQVILKYSIEENQQEDLKKKINLMLGSSSHMLELVNDLLDVAKLESGKFEIHTKSSDIRKLIKKNIEMFGVMVSQAEINLVSKIDDNIPEKIILDPDKISQTISNLLSNAIKFTKKDGKVTVQALFHKKAKNITTEAKDAGIEWFVSGKESDIFKKEDLVVIAVTDSGVGISERDRTQLFNKFKQLEKSAQSEHKGTGLGLSIVKGIINTHGGIVGVASDVGVGSTFFFTLPVKKQ